MQNFEIWKTGVDALLMLSLLLLAFRLLRSPAPLARSRQARDLEHTLRTLVNDAEKASKSLNDHLLRRQTSLQKLLLDLEGTESRTSSMLGTLEEKELTLQRAMARVEGGSRQAPAAPVSAPAPAISASRQAASSHPTAAKVSSNVNAAVEDEIIIDVPEPPSFEIATVSEIEEDAPTPAQSNGGGRTNIYGEPIRAAAPTPAAEQPRTAVARYKALASAIEKEVQAKAAPKKVSDLSAIYSAAEEMIRAGKDIELIAHRTKLPLADVERLSATIALEEEERTRSLENNVEVEQIAPLASQDQEERASSSEAGSDNRLGVLAGIKRQTQVL